MPKRYLLTGLLLLSFIVVFAQKPIATQAYKWKSVQIGGGGFVDGLVYHPTAKNVLYCRTDMGGAYRWNANTKSWESLLDWITYADDNLVGVESIALDPSDPNRLYLACGTYTTSKGPNAILRSDDKGKTFKRTDVPFHMGSNENGRGNGERMMVDPDNSNIIYMGTRHDGLWRSTDRAVTWSKVESFPEITAPVIAAASTPNTVRVRRPQINGIIFILFGNKDSKATHRIIYAGVSQKDKDNLFFSADEGQTWAPVANGPTTLMPTHAVLAKDGALYITYGNTPGPDHMTDGSVWKYNTINGTWKDITPVKPETDKPFGYAAVAVDAQHPQTVITSSFNRGKFGGEDIFRSTDGGLTWKTVFTAGGGGKYDYTNAPYVAHTGIHWLFDLEIDPFNSDHAIFTTGYGLHETLNLTDVDKGKPTTWGVMNRGIEETVGLDLLSPPKGAHLITAIGDYGGFVHNDLDKPVPEGNFLNPHFGNTDGVSCAELNSDVMVRVGEASSQVGGGNIGYSLNGGKSWSPVAATPQPTSKRGFISVSADGNTWIWTPDRSNAYVTHDKGNSWTKIDDLPINTRVIADRLNAQKFYAMDLFGGKLFVSNNSGNSFQTYTLQLPDGLPKSKANRADVRGGQDRIYATPGQEGDLWIAAFDGLYNGKADGVFKKMDHQVQEIRGYGFGKAAPGSLHPAIYLVGVINGVNGVFRSNDAANSWTLINDPQHQWGLVLHVTGDPKVYGRVYVGTHGRGIMYGDPLN